MKRDLAMRALEMAIALRKPAKGCIHHSDLSKIIENKSVLVANIVHMITSNILRQHNFKVSITLGHVMPCRAVLGF